MANVAFVSASAELERLGVGADKQYDVIATSILLCIACALFAFAPLLVVRHLMPALPSSVLLGLHLLLLAVLIAPMYHLYKSFKSTTDIRWTALVPEQTVQCAVYYGLGIVNFSSNAAMVVSVGLLVAAHVCPKHCSDYTMTVVQACVVSGFAGCVLGSLHEHGLRAWLRRTPRHLVLRLRGHVET